MDRTFDARVIGSVMSGVLLVESMSPVHEAIEFLVGHPVWTHELASRQLYASVRDRIDREYPRFPRFAVGTPWQEYADLLVRQYPQGLAFAYIETQRTASPLATLQQVMDDSKAKPTV